MSAPTVEYRPMLVCTSGCWRHNAGTRFPVDRMPSPVPGVIESFVFDSHDAALAHGRAMARNVYGSDLHRVEVDARAVIAADWSMLNALDQPIAVLTCDEHEGQRLLVTVWGDGSGEVATRLDSRWGVPTSLRAVR